MRGQLPPKAPPPPAGRIIRELSTPPRPSAPNWRRDETLLRAAELLEQDARVLFDSYTNRGRWVSSDGSHVVVREEYQERLRIARRLRKAFSAHG